MNVEKVIKAFGGLSRLARLLKVSRQSVFGWKERNKIPESYQGDLIKLAAALDIDISVKDICS